MGMYPSADLNYGIALGDLSLSEPDDGQDHEEFVWLTWELWSDSWEWETASATYLTSQSIEGVQLTNYGHHDDPEYALVTKAIGCHGWGDTTEVTPEALTVTDDDDRLRRAWVLLFPGTEPGPIAWRLSATFG